MSDLLFFLKMRPEAADPAVTVEGGASRPGNKIMSEVFLTRLLSTKVQLHNNATAVCVCVCVCV